VTVAHTHSSNSYRRILSLSTLILLLLFNLEQERAVDVWQYTSEGNGCANQCVEFFITTDSELEMTGGDTLDFEIFRSILLGSVSANVFYV
jgi:hypothetical protein